MTDIYTTCSCGKGVTMKFNGNWHSADCKKCGRNVRTRNGTMIIDFPQKEIGLMFKTEMVLAILNNLKTQTRRMGGLGKVNENPGKYAFWGFENDGRLIFRDGVNLEPMQTSETARLVPQANPPMPTFLTIKPRYQVGDIIYVKETYCESFKRDRETKKLVHRDWNYKADYVGKSLDGVFITFAEGADRSKFKTQADLFVWKSSMFMPKIAARIRLEITDVRVQRLQDISEEDVIAEGIKHLKIDWSHVAEYLIGNNLYVDRFARLWDEINGKKSPWAKNDWVYAVTFKKI